MGVVATLVLPFPPKELSPNNRLHWSKVSRAKKSYRDACHWIAVSSCARALIGKGKKLKVTLIFYPPDRRHRDDDNMEAAFKAGRDGIADALGVNDRFFSVTRKVSHETKNCVEMQIEVVA